MVAHSPDAEFPEIGQILAHLRAVDAAGFGQRVGGNDFHIIAGKIFKHLHVGCKTLDGGAGNVFAFGLSDHVRCLIAWSRFVNVDL